MNQVGLQLAMILLPLLPKYYECTTMITAVLKEVLF